MVDGLNHARRLGETAALQPLTPRRSTPARQDHRRRMLAYARAPGDTLFHPICSCPMGPASNRWRRWTSNSGSTASKGLRVADASIMPTVVSGNTNATCIMIGEKGADMMLAG